MFSKVLIFKINFYERCEPKQFCWNRSNVPGDVSHVEDTKKRPDEVSSSSLKRFERAGDLDGVWGTSDKVSDDGEGGGVEIRGTRGNVTVHVSLSQV